MRRALVPALLLAGAALLALPPKPLPAAEEAAARTLSGEYRSNFGNGPLEARFTPDGEASWKVAFEFVFNGRRHTYRGAARGSLEEGRLEGRVQNEYGRRTFSFRGEFQDGVFRGSHAELVRGRERSTGTLTLEP